MEMKNRIVASGRVIYKYPLNEQETKITLLIKSNRDAYPNFICSNELLPEINKRTHMNIKAFVEGEVDLSDDGNEIFKQVFRADEIHLEEPMLTSKFGVTGKFFYDSKFEFTVSGILENIIIDNEWYRYTILTKKSDGTETKVKMHWKKIDRHPELNIGDKVCAICKISTPEKKVNNKLRHFQDLIVLDMAKQKE